MKIIDTHCHIEQDEFDIDRPSVVEEAKKEGVWMITSATLPSSWSKAILISNQYLNVFASVGLDPMRWNDIDQAVQFIENNSNNLVAIGEVGLDHYYVRDHGERKLQTEAFQSMIELASSLNLPIQIHSRSAGRRALEVLSELDASNVHMHAFDGRASLARFASNELGYYFSIPTSVVRSPQKQKLVRAVALERLLVETDSPVLGAQKSIRNEPKYVWESLRVIADILKRDIEDMRKIILENTLRLYSRITVK